jgi:hypothetical protein
MKNKIFVLGILVMVLVFGMTVMGCATTDGVPFNASAEDQDISIFAGSRDFLSKNYSDAFRAAVDAGYTKVLHVEIVKLGPFGMFGTHIRVTAVPAGQVPIQSEQPES